MTLCSRDLRLEKRTLFRCGTLLRLRRCYADVSNALNVCGVFFCFFPRLDLVPINRSVGLKAKPTKPVTEVLRPVVAKYGLHLSDLVARIVSSDV